MQSKQKRVATLIAKQQASWLEPLNQTWDTWLEAAFSIPYIEEKMGQQTI